MTHTHAKSLAPNMSSASLSQRKTTGVGGTYHLNGAAAMRNALEQHLTGASRSFLPSSIWKSSFPSVEESIKWNSRELSVSGALARCQQLILKVQGSMKTDPTRRFNLGAVIDAIDRYWLDRLPELLEENEGVTASDFLWLALSYLFHVDKQESTSIFEAAKALSAEHIKLEEPYSSVDAYVLAVVKSEVKYRLATYHSGRELYKEIQKHPPPPPIEKQKLLTLSKEEVETLEAKRRQQPDVADPRDSTCLGREVVVKMSDGELLAACSNLVVLSAKEDDQLLSLGSRLYFCTALKRLLLQLAPMETSLPKGVLDLEKGLMDRIQMGCQVSVDQMSTLFRAFLTELHVPAGCFSRFLTLRPFENKQKISSKFSTTMQELLPARHCLGRLIDIISERSEAPALGILKNCESQLHDDFVLFYFGFMFEGYMSRPFTEYLVLTERLYERLERVSSEVAFSIPRRNYRPLIILYGSMVLIKNGNTLRRCRSKKEACLLWIHIVMNEYNGRLEDGKSIKELCPFAAVADEEDEDEWKNILYRGFATEEEEHLSRRQREEEEESERKQQRRTSSDPESLASAVSSTSGPSRTHPRTTSDSQPG